MSDPSGAFEADLDAWEAWDPPKIASMLDGLPTPWCVVGGWARPVDVDEVDLASVGVQVGRQQLYIGARRNAD